MCFFKKKKREFINSKFRLGERVSYYNYRENLIIGTVYKVYKIDNHIYYDIDVAGQCPYRDYKVDEDIIFIQSK